tara:strand:+ start:4832 stop:5662 length:831 start_codon:yes stop_codon:yes gene_type:complete
MSEYYILILLTLLILIIVIVGYFIQRKIRQLELESNTMKCDIESHSDYVSNILNKQNHLIYEIINDSDAPNEVKETLQNSIQTVDFSKINDIIKEDKDILEQQRNDMSHTLDVDDDESSVDNELMSDYDVSSDNISDCDEYGSDCISLNDDNITDDNLSDQEQDQDQDQDQWQEQDQDQDQEQEQEQGQNIRIIKAVGNIPISNNSDNLNMKEDTSVKSIKLKITKTNSNPTNRKLPNEKASDFETGYTIISSNNNKEYKVVESQKGIKRWVLVKS